ncbi:MAG: hypothetical protein JO199_00070 [Candidatus Eremiobacteraeota bacterium]|nr:hypothetical protein [Candidatus Eremiobacteraeota bacterium]
MLVFYEGNTTPSVKLFFGKAGESTQGVAIGGSPQMAYVAGMGKIFACEPDVKIAAECSIAARDLQRVIYGLAIDSSEALYVADPLAGNVLKCPSGSLPRHCSVKVSFFPEMSPHGLAIGTGDALYIANSLQSTVQRCTFPTQNRTICTVQTVPSYPYGIAAAPNNQFAVSSLTLDGVFLCSTAFCFLEIFGLRQPEGVAIDAAGTTIVADSGNRRLLACAPSRPAQPPRCSVVPIRKPLMPTFLAAIPTL